MLNQILLKLIWSHFTTSQIHQLFNKFPNFLEVDELEQNYLLRKFVLNNSNENHSIKNELYSRISFDEIMSNIQQSKLNFITCFDKGYPSYLKEIYDYPFVLFYKGSINILSSPKALAVVGSRVSSNYTTKALNHLFYSFQQSNLTIVSGLAQGADAMAHQTALKYNLPTIAVLGFGHQTHYPKSTRALRHKIEEKGLVISEYPPHTPIARYRFPERNRIISGLSKGVLITEAKEQSGSHITIDFALEQNRNVYVLPGSMFNPMTKGNLLRIQEGAKVVLNANDILEDYFI
ncbi:DNA-protecting protein DprA [Staphylococcus argenteus]|uniref:DNA-processing protein DprA n=1 Tax=Staphylococcus argenteus TaxID=985002 RepID=UPI00178CDD34|nr:DNA-processing protein DprA [Staphylococcus argenteus]MBE2135870.1 DNA-protecting protein DprA [Staphylococcus argenteus]